MSVEASVQNEIKEKQLAGCPSENKLSIVITGHRDDATTKATFYNFVATRIVNGVEKSSQTSYRYSQLLEFNEKLIYNYGAIRLLRVFPPKKFVGNRDGDFVVLRRDAIQEWATELCLDEEVCEDKDVLEFFKLTE
ncbi:PX domain containing protein [Trichomonas vaginalis G3]|uniref:PX domain containing protein n=1 Tax=Trichomonas vaginalis (strain ATCC PRA-98 / G3) TaxID=412133 RepID=A2FGT0_TRIV3|nr:sorting nexin C terminal-containing protein [Trichomonas vaginalis G3]EAX95874.1 PX domain containing protein [Trichomonas vaginalis G3]KAI5528799.1 sorting nexin C terminal-containing protein [Trichomonas vaginalis G3]|eukprot:XP_001308804.1 PX domain containing protein [Trichomonas vaginalis G3]